jgi:homoserine O-acetyltransferase
VIVRLFVAALLLQSSARTAPPECRVRLETSKGAIVIAVHRNWAPHGADRFYELVTAGYYDDTRFFRVVKGQWAQFGINGDPQVSAQWRNRTIPDDPNKASVTRGRVAFAFKDPNGRTTQVYISLRDNSSQDAQGFAPFGEVVQGMDVADALYSEYGETSGGGIRAGRQQPLFDGGNAYLDRQFPRLDRIIRASIVP